MEKSLYQARETALFKYVDNEAEHVSSQSVDDATQALNKAYAQELHNNPDFHANFSLILETRPKLTPSNIGRRGFKAIVASAMAEIIEIGAASSDRALIDNIRQGEQDRFAVLAERTEVQNWRPTLDAISNDPLRNERFTTSLFLPITSNVSDRSGLLKTAIKLHKPAEEPIRLLELGCSLGHTTKRLKLEARDPLFFYKKTRALHRWGKDDEQRFIHDPRDTKMFNRLLWGTSLLLDECVGVDLLDFDNPMFSSWAISNSRYLGELKNDRLSKQFSALLNYEDSTTNMVVKDVTELQPEMIGEPADVTYAGFMFYQVEDRAEVDKALANAEACTKDDGLVIIYDFCDLDENGQPMFYDQDAWPNWSCSVLVKDKQRPELGWQKYYSVKNGRATDIIIEDAARQAPNAKKYGLAD